MINVPRKARIRSTTQAINRAVKENDPEQLTERKVLKFHEEEESGHGIYGMADEIR